MADEAKEYVCPPSVVKWLNHPIRKLIQNPRKILVDYVLTGDIAVDLGCGGGFFAVELARMVGESGRVIAVDMQEEMLDITRNFARKKGVLERITLHQCKADDLDLTGEKVDFALAMYVVHEVPDRKAFFDQVAKLLKPQAHFAMIEPRHHVTPPQFEQILNDAASVGLKQVKPVKVMMSRGMVFMRESLE